MRWPSQAPQNFSWSFQLFLSSFRATPEPTSQIYTVGSFATGDNCCKVDTIPFPPAASLGCRLQQPSNLTTSQLLICHLISYYKIKNKPDRWAQPSIFPARTLKQDSLHGIANHLAFANSTRSAL
jgi:hypothetical protein